jgi:hypothetical protein
VIATAPVWLIALQRRSTHVLLDALAQFHEFGSIGPQRLILCRWWFPVFPVWIKRARTSTRRESVVSVHVHSKVKSQRVNIDAQGTDVEVWVEADCEYGIVIDDSRTVSQIESLVGDASITDLLIEGHDAFATIQHRKIELESGKILLCHPHQG